MRGFIKERETVRSIGAGFVPAVRECMLAL